jgi:amidohydrolase
MNTSSLEIDRFFPHMVEVRRTLHQYPELAYQEEKTAAIVMDELRRLEIPFQYGGRGGGILARIPGRVSAAPAIALRAELDGLPVSERTGLHFASRHPDRMHACGHDGHMAIVLGAAAMLKAAPPRGDVVLIFQPGEETGRGARVVIEAGALDGVGMIFAGHMTRHHRTGEIVVPKGLVSARSEQFAIRVQGRAGHGARPHEGVDAVVTAGALILAIQTLVSREVDPFHPAVLSIGKVAAGDAPNVIADHALLEGIIRTTQDGTHQRILGGLERMAYGTAAAHNAHVDVEVTTMCPAVVNPPRETEIARRAACRVVGDAGLLLMEAPSMGADDFSYYLEQVPGCYVRFGARGEGWPEIPLHSPEFDFDEESLKVGATFFDALVREAHADLEA